MQKPPVLKKPPIAAKPRNVQKTNYVVIPSQSFSDHPQNNRTIPTPTRQLRNADEQQQLFSSSSPTYQIHYFSTSSSGECTNDVQQQQLKRQNFNNGIAYTNGVSEEHVNDNNGSSHRTDNKSFNHTPSHSFDSSGSSSSGGFREVDYVAKTKALYEPHNDNLNSNNHEIPSSYPIPSHHHASIGHSKIQEIQSKLLQQKQQQIIQNHVSSEQIAINRAQYQKSTQELEKLFGLRVAASEKEIRHQPQVQHPKVSIVNQEKPAMVRRMSAKSNGDDEVDHSNNLSSLTAQLTLNISKQIQQKLQAEMKQQCEIIKEKYLIEKVPVQLHYCDFAVVHFLIILFSIFHYF